MSLGCFGCKASEDEKLALSDAGPDLGLGCSVVASQWAGVADSA